jgi:hypothetical protein
LPPRHDQRRAILRENKKSSDINCGSWGSSRESPLRRNARDRQASRISGAEAGVVEAHFEIPLAPSVTQHWFIRPRLFDQHLNRFADELAPKCVAVPARQVR